MRDQSSDVRTKVRDAIRSLALDNIALRKFYEAFQFRRGVGATDEGGAQDEVRALRRALNRAFNCERSGVGFSSEAGVPEIVEGSFLDKLVFAVDIADPLWEKEMGWFIRDLEVGVIEGIVEAFFAYAFRSRNSLDGFYH